MGRLRSRREAIQRAVAQIEDALDGEIVAQRLGQPAVTRHQAAKERGQPLEL